MQPVDVLITSSITWGGGGKPRGLVESIVTTAPAILSLLRSGCKGGIVLIIALISRGCEERGGTQRMRASVYKISWTCISSRPSCTLQGYLFPHINN